jgi:creatinine amidohydrolase
MSLFFADRTSPEIEALAERHALVLLPVGQVEEHGQHLPVNTDALIAERVAAAAAGRVADEMPVLVMPTVWTGYSAAAMSRWAGTIRLDTRTFTDLIYGVCSSLIEMGFDRIVIVNAHGHHPALLETAVREVADEHDVHVAIAHVWTMGAEAFRACRKSKPGGAIHGGEFETSLMLHLRAPVDMSKATDVDVMRYESEFAPADGFSGSKKVFWSTWGIQESTTGIYGDPTVASAETGRIVFEAIVENTASFLREFRRWHER